MTTKNLSIIVLITFALFLNACSFASFQEPTATPTTTHTPVPTSTVTPTPTRTPLPTKTPNLAATQRVDEWNAEIQGYFEKGYLHTADGSIKELGSFVEEWAQMDWYTTWLLDETVDNFVFSAHFKWSSASKTPNQSGCGFVYAIQDDGSDYSVFLDQAGILYLRSEFNHGFRVGRTRGTGQVKVGDPTEADFTLIVDNYYSYVLVDGEVIGEYTLPQSDPLKGEVGVSILSGTNKDYGTRCQVTDMRLWTPAD
jgi:hypothetical protein